MAMCVINIKQALSEQSFLPKGGGMLLRLLLPVVSMMLAMSCAWGAPPAGQASLQLQAGEPIEYQTARAEGRILFLKSPHGEITVISRRFAPVSIHSVRQQLRKLKGDPRTLVKKMIPLQGAIFGFQDRHGQLHFFSTRGGYLQVTSSHQAGALKTQDWISKLVFDGEAT
jgi:hypothetical protein